MHARALGLNAVTPPSKHKAFNQCCFNVGQRRRRWPYIDAAFPPAQKTQGSTSSCIGIPGSVFMQIQSCYYVFMIFWLHSLSTWKARQAVPGGYPFFLLGPSKHLHKTFNQCCYNVRPASPSLAHHWETNSSNNFHPVCWIHSQRLRLFWRCRWRNFAALGEGLSN